jgi:pyruvate/2-oxoglutarate dehydrogenase complex dihydrolipoamide acyltransferase (E2) component
MTTDYVMPKLAMAMNEGTINEWLVSDGAYVEKGQAIITVETEKVSYDLDSPNAGYLHIVVPAGETVPVEVVIARFTETEEQSMDTPAGANETPPPAGAEPSLPSNTQEQKAGDRIKVTPVVKKLAREHGIDLATITGSGPGGRIVKRDIMDVVNNPEPLPVESVAASASPDSPASSGSTLAAAGSAGTTELARIPVKGKTRAIIASRMQQSLQSTAQLSSGWDSDVTELLAVRKRLATREEQLGTRISVNAFLIKAMVYAIRQIPLANSALVGDEIILYDTINVGIAVALPGETEYDSTLIVPVLKHVERMGLVEIDVGMKSLIERARRSALTAEDMTESTITISSTAGIAPPGMQSTPILNIPNAMIVGPSTPCEKPVVVNGQIVPRMMLPISVTFDHRVIDGEPAARFIKHLHECLENPELLLT